MYNYSSSPRLTNCSFRGNTGGDGGGVYNDYSSSPTVSNCTFAGNMASPGLGNGLYNGPYSSSNLTNCIVWDGSSNAIYSYGSGTSTVTYSDVQGGFAGIGNINADPLFIDADGPDNIYGTADDNLRLQPSSPCLDAGSNAAVPAGATTDLEGNARFIDIPGAHDPGAIVDMGAYERQPPLVASGGSLVVDAPAVKFAFNNAVLASSLAAGDVMVRTVLPDGSLGGTISVLSATYDPATKSASFTIPVATPDGNYRATLLAGSVSDTYGSSPAADYSTDFFILAGDANHDRKVDVSDLHVLANNYGTNGKTFSQGDFNYDGTVDNADLAILAARWQYNLTAPASSMPASLVSPPRRTAVRAVALVEQSS
jgi:hypothetical protein